MERIIGSPTVFVVFIVFLFAIFAWAASFAFARYVHAPFKWIILAPKWTRLVQSE